MFPFRDYVDLFDGAARQIDFHSVETDTQVFHPKITGKPAVGGTGSRDR